MPSHRALWLLLLVAMVVRSAVLVSGPATPNDPDSYLPLSRSLAAGRGLCFEDGKPTAYRPPLYPMVLAPIVGSLGRFAPRGIAGLHLLLGLGAVALTFLTARRWGLSMSRAIVAGAIVAFDPVAVSQSRSVMTETLAMFLVALNLNLIARGPGHRFVAGVSFGVASLCRPSLMPGAGLCALAMAFGEGSAKDRLRSIVVFGLGTILPMVPWAVRNAYQFGSPVWTTTHGGYTLALANNPAYYADVLDGPPDAVWTGPNQAAWFDRVGLETIGMGQVEADRYLRQRGLGMLRDRPRDFLRASVARFGRFWGIAPSGRVYPLGLRVVTAIWTVPLWLTLIVGMGRRDLWKWPRVAAPMLILGLSAVHLVYWTDMRMRVPIVPAIALIASTARSAKAGDRRRDGCDLGGGC